MCLSFFDQTTVVDVSTVVWSNNGFIVVVAAVVVAVVVAVAVAVVVAVCFVLEAACYRRT